MPEANKERLVATLAAREVPLIEDDLYGDLHFGPARPCAAKSFDRRGLVLHCGSFSKTLAPGWRIGWVSPGRFRERVALLKFAQTIATASLQQLALGEFLAAGHYERHLKSLRKAVGATMRSLGDWMAAHFPAGTRATRPDGGGMLWMEPPDGISALALHDRALEAGIAIAPGPIFSAPGGYQSCIRLSSGVAWSPRVEAASPPWAASPRSCRGCAARWSGADRGRCRRRSRNATGCKAAAQQAARLAPRPGCRPALAGTEIVGRRDRTHVQGHPFRRSPCRSSWRSPSRSSVFQPWRRRLPPSLRSRSSRRILLSRRRRPR
jgi:hypothetical protein